MTRHAIAVTRTCLTLIAIAPLTLAACGASASDARIVGAPAGQATRAPAAPVELGAFPDFPRGELAPSVGASLQKILDEAVAQGEIQRAAAAVIIVGAGSWVGASGDDEHQVPITPAGSIPMASVGKTITAAEILQLADEGKIDLDDPPAKYLPPRLARFDLNQASIRDLLGMRSGFRDPYSYESLVDEGYTTAQLLALLPPPFAPAGATVEYTNINFVVLGEIIEHVTGHSLWEAVRAGVLDDPVLDGVTYPVTSALAGDGWRVEADPATLARWGYELYGGHVLPPAALDEMLDFRGQWYGLGVADFSHPDAPAHYDSPAVGHGGWGEPFLVRLAVFPQTATIVSVLADARDVEGIAVLAAALRDASRP